MEQIEINIFRRGRNIAQATRYLYHFDGQPFVKYKRKLRPLINGKNVLLDGIPPALNAQDANPSSMVAEQGESITESDVIPPALIKWDESQLKIIDASPDDKLLVAAGPGTGKTAVACARVSQLIDQSDLAPGRIWLISFTRTAVREIRDRIATYLNDESNSFAVKIATLDSHAWAIHSGFDEEAKY